jgi:hypothetical protein
MNNNASAFILTASHNENVPTLNLMKKTHSKSKTASTIPYRRSFYGNDPHKVLTNQASINTVSGNAKNLEM